MFLLLTLTCGFVVVSSQSEEEKASGYYVQPPRNSYLGPPEGKKCLENFTPLWTKKKPFTPIVAVRDWLSAEIIGYAFGIVFSEVLGMKSFLKNMAGRSGLEIYRCDLSWLDCPEEDDPFRIDVDPENWRMVVTTEANYVELVLNRKRIYDAGIIGFSGQVGIFISPKTVIEDNPELFVDYYKSHFVLDKVKKYFPKAGTLSCTTLGLDPEGPDCLKLDLEEFNLNNPKEYYNVTWLNSEAQFIPPHCQDPADECSEMYGVKPTWENGIMEGLVVAYKLPYIITYIGGDLTTHLQTVLKGKPALHYWWTPDPYIAALNSGRLSFPPYFPGCEVSGNLDKDRFRLCDFPATNLVKGVSLRVRRDFPELYKVIENFVIFRDDINGMMEATQHGGGNLTNWDTACDWVKNNIERIKSWVPLCESGEVFDSASLKCVPQCPEGLALDEDLQCSACPSGFQAVRLSESETSCVACDPGTVINSCSAKWGEDEEVPEGRAAGDKKTPDELFGDVAAGRCELKCSACPTGQFQSLKGQSKCEVCAPGTFRSLEVDGSACRACSPGSYQAEEGASECHSCERGFYQPLFGQTDCSSCVAIISHSTTDGRGFQSPSSCSCDKGSTLRCADPSTGDLTGCLVDAVAAAALDNLSRKESPMFSCTECDGEFEECEGFVSESEVDGEASQIHTQPKQLPGFYAAADRPYEVYKCKNEVHCPGNSYPGHSCGVHRRDLACANCEIGYVSDKKGLCAECTEGDYLPFVIIILFAFATAIGIFFLTNSPITSKLSTTLTISISLGMLLTSIQATTVLSQSTLEFSEPWLSLLSFIKIFSFDIDVIKLACHLTSTDVARKFLARILMPIGLFVFYGGLYLATRFSQKWSKVFSLNKVINTVLQLFQAVYIIVTLVSIIPFQCFEHPNKESSLVLWPEVLCGGEEHTTVLVLGVFSTLLYTVGFLGFCIYLIVRAPSESTKKGSTFLQRYRFLFYRFRFDRYWWGAPLLLRNALLAIVPIFDPNDAQLHILMLICVLVVFLTLHCICWPWRSNALNVAEALTLSLMIVLVAACNVFLPPRLRAQGITGYTSFIVIIFLLIVVVIFSILGHSLLRLRNSKVEAEKGRLKNEAEDLTKRVRDWAQVTMSSNHSYNFKFISSLSPFDRDKVYIVMDLFMNHYKPIIEQSDKFRAMQEGTLSASKSAWHNRIALEANENEDVLSMKLSFSVEEVANGPVKALVAAEEVANGPVKALVAAEEVVNGPGKALVAAEEGTVSKEFVDVCSLRSERSC